MATQCYVTLRHELLSLRRLDACGLGSHDVWTLMHGMGDTIVPLCRRCKNVSRLCHHVPISQRGLATEQFGREGMIDIQHAWVLGF